MQQRAVERARALVRACVRAACHARASCSADRREAAGAQCGARGLNVQNRQGCCAGCMQTAQQPCSGNGERARWPARAACRRARLAVKHPAGRDALRCGMVPEEGAGACAMGVDLSGRCTAARASRREWSCAWLWWCERRVAGAGGAGRPWGASTGQTHMTQASGRYACVCVRAGTYAQFSRGVRGEGHERRRPRVYWRVGVRSMPGGRGGLGRLDFALGVALPALKKSRVSYNWLRNLMCLRAFTHGRAHD